MFQKIIEYPDTTEKLQLKFCKSILGVHKKSMKMPVLAELGRYPLFFQLIGQVITFWVHIIEMKQNSCISDAYSDLFKEGAHVHSPWIQFVKTILKNLGFSHVWNNQGTMSCKRLKHAIVNKLIELYKVYWNNTKQNENVSRLHFYNKFTKFYRMEPYLSSNNFEVRRTMSRFRLSAHDLAIEKGRQQNIPRNNRLCNICNVIEDEEHFLNECKIYQEVRKEFLADIQTDCHVSLITLMSNDRVQKELSLYIHKCFALRKGDHLKNRQ